MGPYELAYEAFYASTTVGCDEVALSNIKQGINYLLDPTNYNFLGRNETIEFAARINDFLTSQDSFSADYNTTKLVIRFCCVSEIYLQYYPLHRTLFLIKNFYEKKGDSKQIAKEFVNFKSDFAETP